MTPKKACIIIPLIVLLISACGRPVHENSHLAADTQQISKDFSFKLLTSDIFPWVDGRQSGIVGPDKKNHARYLERLITSTRSEMMIGIYGVQDQPWFFDALGLEEGRKIRAVVDQAKGELNDWVPENFTYPHTAELGKKLSESNVLPDLNPTGTPRASSIMHDKFIVFKNKGVWTGSTNISSNCLGSEYNANASIYIAVPELARIFQAEFEQMFMEKKFSIYKQTISNKSLRFRDGTKLDVFFSPQDRPISNAVIPFIDAAHETLDIGMFVLSHPDVVVALEKAARRGVQVRLLVDALFASRDISPVRRLKAAGVDVRIENWGGKMHMKNAVADGRKSILGSMNWTKAGELENDENTLLIDNRALATEMTAYFDNLWKSLDNIENETPIAESKFSINSCNDGIDNDYDGLIDADEPLCSGAIF